MSFQRGDMVEIVSGQEWIPDRLRPGQRGIVIGWHGHGFGLVAPRVFDLWDVNFDGDIAICGNGSIRKVPPDPGRDLVQWHTVPWQPNRVRVDAGSR